MECDDRRSSYLPEEWSSEERMRVLMGPMPAGAQEEVSRAARHTFWAAAIHTWARDTLTPCFKLNECQGAFRRGTQIPQCLPEVLQLMMTQGDVVPLDQLSLGEQQTESWLGWGRRVLLARPTQMVWGQVKRAVGLDVLRGTVLVCRSVLQEMCNTVLDKVWREKGSDTLLTTLGELYTLVGGVVGCADNLHLVVEVLAAEGRATTLTHHNTTYVKFVHPGDTGRPAITQEELAKSDLEEAKVRVQSRLDSLEGERDALRSQAKAALSRGAKTEALSLLKRRKRVDQSVVTQLGVLENVTSWLQNLHDVQTNRQVLGALKGGVEALRAALGGDTSPDAAAATLDDLQQVLEECDELNSLVTQNPMAEDDMSSLEEELEDLMLADAGQGLEGEHESTLPDVPTTLPFITVPTPRLSS